MRLISVFVALIFLSACGITEKNGNRKNKSETVTIESAEDSPLLDTTQVLPKLYHATRTQLVNLVHTKLAVSFDWDKSWMLGQATLTLKPHFYVVEKFR